MDELLRFIDIMDKKINKYHASQTKREEILARTVKLGEEFGELCDEILATANWQRQEKMQNRNEISEEFADVLITTLILAKSMDIDIQEAVKKKKEKINKRYD